MIKKISLITVMLCVIFLISPAKATYSQSQTEVTCGQILQKEFTNNIQEHIYILDIDALWSFEISVEPFGDFLNTIIAVYGPTEIRIGLSNPQGGGGLAHVKKTPSVNSGILSATGRYKIRVANTPLLLDGLYDDPQFFGGVGRYKLLVGCTTSDGDKIKPESNAKPIQTPGPSSTSHTAVDNVPDFSGVGFPGLAPVDFSTVAKVPLLPDTVMTGVLPTGNEILGFTLDATAGDTLDLSYTRVSGNMNLGLVVLSEENEVFFQASLVTSESLATTFTLPTEGEYTIGVFRISLVEPDEVESTVFQLQGSLITN